MSRLATKSRAAIPFEDRPLWQVPAFLLGCACVVGVWFARPYLQPSPEARYAAKLDKLQALIEKVPPDTGEVVRTADAIRAVDAPPKLAPRGHYLIGSAYLALAEASPFSAEAVAWRKLALQELNAIDPEDLADADRGRMIHRLAKLLGTEVVAGAPGDADGLIKALKSAADCGDDPAEAYRIIGELALHKNPADIDAAKEGFRDYLSRALPRTDANRLHQARVRLGELLVQSQESDEARKVLERVGSDAAGEFFVAAKLLLAKSYQKDGDWHTVLRQLEAARDAKDFPAAMRPTLSYRLAEGYAQTNRKAEAVAALKEVPRDGSSQARAAELKLLAIEAAQIAPEEAVRRYESATQGLQNADEFRTPLMSVAEAREISEALVEQFRRAGQYDVAASLCRTYAPLAGNNRDRVLLGETLEMWGNTLVKQAETATGDDQEKLKAMAKERFSQALEAGRKVIANSPDMQGRVDRLAKSVSTLLQAGQGEAALAQLDELLAEKDLPESTRRDFEKRQVDALLLAGQKLKARSLLEKLLAKAGPDAGRLRLQQAKLLLETGVKDDFDAGVKLLEANLEPSALQADPSSQEPTLVSLGYLWFQKREWPTAIGRFEEALRLFPESPLAAQIRFNLGLCHWYQAGGSGRKLAELEEKLKGEAVPLPIKKELQAARDAAEREYRTMLNSAFEEFEALEKGLLEAEKGRELSGGEKLLLQQAGFKAAACTFGLGMFEDCVPRYERLARQYKGQIDELVALSQLWQCYAVYLERAQEAKFTLSRMKETFQRLPEKEFSGENRERKRDFWEKWIKDVEASGPENP